MLISAGTMGYWIVKGKIAAIYLSQEKECHFPNTNKSFTCRPKVKLRI